MSVDCFLWNKHYYAVNEKKKKNERSIVILLSKQHDSDKNVSQVNFPLLAC